MAKQEDFGLVKDYPRHKFNPFLVETLGHLKPAEKFRRVQNKPDNYVDVASGEMIQVYDIQKGKNLIDHQPFLKSFIYHSTSFLEEFDAMPKCARKVMLYIIRMLERDRDVIMFSVSDCQAYGKYPNRQSVTNGLAWLLANKFIARTEMEFKYYVNPTKVFNGTRTKIVNANTFAKPNKIKGTGEGFENNI